jgi:hypothetical protein
MPPLATVEFAEKANPFPHALLAAAHHCLLVSQKEKDENSAVDVKFKDAQTLVDKQKVPFLISTTKTAAQLSKQTNTPSTAVRFLARAGRSIYGTNADEAALVKSRFPLSTYFRAIGKKKTRSMLSASASLMAVFNFRLTTGWNLSMRT